MLSDSAGEACMGFARSIVHYNCHGDDYHPDALAHCVDALFSLSSFDATQCARRPSKLVFKEWVQWSVMQAINDAYQPDRTPRCKVYDKDYLAFRMLYRTFPRIRDAVHTIENLKVEDYELDTWTIFQKLTDEDRAIAATAKEPVHFVGYTAPEILKMEKDDEKRRIEWQIKCAKEINEKRKAEKLAAKEQAKQLNQQGSVQ
jgi:hypothetical protein